MRRIISRSLLVLPFILVIMMSVTVVRAAVGTGVLYVYLDAGRTQLAATEPPQGHYLVVVGVTYYIRILGITEFDLDDELDVKIGYTANGNIPKTYVAPSPVLVQEASGALYIDVEWMVPGDAQVCTTATVHYSVDTAHNYVAAGLLSTIGHMHVIPELPIGTIASVMAAFAGFGLIRLKSRQFKK